MMPPQGKSSKLRSRLRKISPRQNRPHTIVRPEQQRRTGDDSVADAAEPAGSSLASDADAVSATGQNAAAERRPSQASVPRSSDGDSLEPIDEMPVSDNSILYQQLSHLQSFRVLEILPARKPSSQLRCRLKTASLGTGDGPYDALSYTWGDTEPRHNVICNGSALEVTPNLHAALLRLRSPSRTVTIWADQICINQKDLAERSQQVQIMRDIYSQADEVLVWLGGDDPAEDETWKRSHIGLGMAVQRIKMLSEEHVREHYGFSQLTHYDYHTGEPQYGWTTEGFTGEYYHWHKENAMGAAGSPAWDAVRFFFSRPWFTRIWVVQELAVSRSVKVLLGNDELSWEDVENAANYVDTHEYGEMLNTALACGDHLSNLLETAAIPTRACLSMASIRKQVQRDPQSPRNDLLELLELTRPSQATDTRDKIIAMLGLCRGIDITPNYTISAEDLFHTTTTELIRTTRTSTLSPKSSTPT